MSIEERNEVIAKTISAFGGVDCDEVFEVFKGLKIEDVRNFRTATPKTLTSDVETVYRPMAGYGPLMRSSYLHFHDALVLWAKHPEELDATLMISAFGRAGIPRPILTEVLSTRTPKALMGARNVFERMCGTSIEDQLVAYIPLNIERVILTVLCKGVPKPAKTDNKFNDLLRDSKYLLELKKRGGMEESEDKLEIPHSDEDIQDEATLITLIEEHYKGLDIKVSNHDDFMQIMMARRDPVSFFVDLLDKAFIKKDATAVSRIFVTRAMIDLEQIKKKFHEKNGITLESKVEQIALGHYKALLKLLMSYSYPTN